jgi:thiosulfate/3-mercaptopyruvate sulfurtransferase
VAVAAGTSAAAATSVAAATSERGGALPPFVDADWLDAHRDEVVLADVRWYLDGRSGRAAYDAGHLPGAIFVDLDVALSGPPSAERGRHPFPTPERFAIELGRLGIGDGATVIAYDDSGGSTAGRLVWMLRAIGARAALLDGGLIAHAGALATAPTVREPVVRTPVPWPADRLVDADAVAAATAATGTAPVLDARSPERFRGEPNPVDPRFGHVPGARNVSWAGLLGPDGRVRLDRLPALDPGPEPPIAYCGSGVSACLVLLALEAAGSDRARLFPGSWSQWGSDPARPVATCPEKPGALQG